MNRGLSSIVGADHARWHTPRAHRPSTMDSCPVATGDLKVASFASRMTLLAIQVSAEQSVGWMTAMHHRHQSGLFRSGRREAAKTLTDCSALSWTQELGLACLESGRRAASNDPSCFSRRLKLTERRRTGLWVKQGTTPSFRPQTYTYQLSRRRAPPPGT